MKFCTKCGGQCIDEAVICVSCGAPIAPVAAPSAPVAANVALVAPSAAPLKSGDNKIAIFDFLSTLSIVLYVAMFFLTIVYAWVGSNFYLPEVGILICGIISVLAFVFAILRLVTGLSCKDNLAVKLSGVFRFITALIMMLVSLLALIEHK